MYVLKYCIAFLFNIIFSSLFKISRYVQSSILFGWKNPLPFEEKNGKAIYSLGLFDLKNKCSSEKSLLAILPEAVRLTDCGLLEGKIVKATYLGQKSEYITSCNGTEINATIQSKELHTDGKKITFSLINL